MARAGSSRRWSPPVSRGAERGEARETASDQALNAAMAFARRKRIGPFASDPADPDRRRKQLQAFIRAGHDFALARALVFADSMEEIAGLDEQFGERDMVTRFCGAMLATLALVACNASAPSDAVAQRPAAGKLALSPAGLDLVPLTIRSGAKTHKFTVEMARSSQREQAQGLMFRTELAPDAGMLFPFPTPKPASFWMKNTVISLDLLVEFAPMAPSRASRPMRCPIRSTRSARASRSLRCSRSLRAARPSSGSSRAIP